MWFVGVVAKFGKPCKQHISRREAWTYLTLCKCNTVSSRILLLLLKVKDDLGSAVVKL